MKEYEGYKVGKMLCYIQDPEIISFAGGLPSSDVFPLDLIQKAAEKSLKEDPHHVLQYSAISGEKELMEAIIGYLQKDGIHIKPENIMITKGMEAGIEDLISQGRKPKFIYVVPDFQNPSGITMSLEKRLSLLSAGKKYGIPLIEDSPYRELRYKGENIPPIYSLDKNQGNVIGIYTFSKILCPGLRVGFNIGPSEVIRKFSFIKGANILNTPKLNQDICTAFLREYDLDAHFNMARKYYSEKLTFFLEAMEENFPEDMGVEWTKPEGGLFLWITMPEKVNTLELFYEAAKEKVAFVPGEVCYPKGHVKHNTMRINFSYPTKDEIAEGVKRLSFVVKKYLTEKKKNILSK